jgi:SM-20-related protein
MDVDAIADGLRSEGFVAVEDWLPPALLAGLDHGCDGSEAARFSPGGVGRGPRRTGDDGVRGDVVRWLDDGNEPDQAYLTLMEGLRLDLNEQLYLGLLDYDGHYAIYGAGSHYQRHLDTLTGAKNRLLSTVVYLNPEWAPADGGELILYRGSEQRPTARILPQPGLMVLFLSEDFPHEVLAARKPRHSLAGWFRGRASSPETR